jgi:hypothetical protein
METVDVQSAFNLTKILRIANKYSTQNAYTYQSVPAGVKDSSFRTRWTEIIDDTRWSRIVSCFIFIALVSGRNFIFRMHQLTRESRTTQLPTKNMHNARMFTVGILICTQSTWNGHRSHKHSVEAPSRRTTSFETNYGSTQRFPISNSRLQSQIGSRAFDRCSGCDIIARFSSTTRLYGDPAKTATYWNKKLTQTFETPTATQTNQQFSFARQQTTYSQPTGQQLLTIIVIVE